MVLNYRHAFHAGNFADVHKHAILLQALAGLTTRREPLTVVDTHAGAGMYDLEGELAQRSREAEAGIGRLLADHAAPPAFAPLRAAVEQLNGGRDVRLYPGSPRLIADALRPGDGYLGCELRPDDHAALARVLAEAARPGGSRLEARLQDGYALAANFRPDRNGRTLLLIDPPYERGDDPARTVQTLAAAARPGLAALVWAPIKDLESYDALLRALETLPFREGWTAEVRLRPLSNPMRLNGSAMIGLGLPTPPGAEAISAWTAASAGEPGAIGRVSPLFS